MENIVIQTTYETLNARYMLTFDEVSMYGGTYDLPDTITEYEIIATTVALDERDAQEVAAEAVRMLLRTNRNLIVVERIK